MLAVLTIMALACLAAASPVSVQANTAAAAANSDPAATPLSFPPICKVGLNIIRLNKRDLPGRFDVGDGFWIANDQACAVTALQAGYHGAVYRRDTQNCYFKNIPKNDNRKIEKVNSSPYQRIENYDIPGYDATFLPPEDETVPPWKRSDLVVSELRGDGIWYKRFPGCEACVLMVIGDHGIVNCS
ncbi:hypothetical protein BC828DRAFT_388088 [Blastocladiella britannica]|nr:hypothetical protein BC828DRAFT_388088 [Blastocladiella britannica]